MIQFERTILSQILRFISWAVITAILLSILHEFRKDRIITIKQEESCKSWHYENTVEFPSTIGPAKLITIRVCDAYYPAPSLEAQ